MPKKPLTDNEIAYRKIFSERLILCFEKLNLLPTRLIDILGLSSGHASNVATGKHDLSAYQLYVLKQAYPNIDLNGLICGSAIASNYKSIFESSMAAEEKETYRRQKDKDLIQELLLENRDLRKQLDECRSKLSSQIPPEKPKKTSPAAAV
jgi:hypothetical protein